MQSIRSESSGVRRACHYTTKAAGTALLLFALASTAGSGPLWSALSNFDAYNDTGHLTHGLESELDGPTATDVRYTFGGTHHRYGTTSAVSIVRRHEFYKCAGAYNPESHEALWAGGSGSTRSGGDRGQHLGAQMAAINLDAQAGPVPEPVSLALIGTGLCAIGLLLRRRR